MRRLFVCLLLVGYILNLSSINVWAVDPVDELQTQIDELGKLKKMSEDATANLESEVKNIAARVASAQRQVANIKVQLKDLEASIQEREETQAEKTKLLESVVAKNYKASRQSSPLLVLLKPNQAHSSLLNALGMRRAQERNHEQITTIASEIATLQSDKVTLEQTSTRLVALEAQLSEQEKFFEHEITEAKKYQQVLGSKIEELSARQKEIINARSGTSITAVGDVPAADDPKASIEWKASAPANHFAVFSFGAYTHRNGMSQYGAKARADAGQNVEEILAHYYPGTHLEKNYNEMDEINVQGYGRMSFEGQYLQSIYEMPGGWPLEALKAQAIAARTFAIRHTNNGNGSICTTEACQVYKNGKKGGAWEQAVNETRGWVLVDDSGNPVSTQYASTHGGYANTSGWDTTDGSGENNWSERAWETKAGSPWFYKAWWRSGYSSSGDSCGRESPWLSQEEMCDILNAYIVRSGGTNADIGRIQPITINSCHIGGSGGNPYSMEELKTFANQAGGAVTHIDGVSVSHGDNGQTAQVRFETNRGTMTLSGSEFKQIFNLRAPGYLRIPQSSFASFNIEFKQ
ncbi:SpoIID/LytB domain-containing protein [bacterium]|nr:SpoIID/LytB domain-containing protein [bacterium]